MATTNIWQEFKAPLPEGSRTIVTITALYGSGTSPAQLRGDSMVTVSSESVGVEAKAFVQNSEVKGAVLASESTFHDFLF
ncbi:hypothetical protein ACH42_03385 [Endozoicomonas sp. (ex Bugula neritina AB1)]|nr:hypothetical protein ACH42_03385 [Endozoicomonas sp. (ex Bugula neritina AB1)]